MRMLFVQNLRKGLPVLLMAGALTACGPSESQNGPAFFTGSLTVSPPSLSLSVGPDPNPMTPSPAPCASAGTNPQSFPFFPFVITVRNDKGIPLGNVDINIVLDFAGNTTLVGDPVVTFLIDGVIVSAPGAPVPYSTTTDNDGTKTVFVQFLAAGACTYAGAMTVTSGPLFAQMQFDVTE